MDTRTAVYAVPFRDLPKGADFCFSHAYAHGDLRVWTKTGPLTYSGPKQFPCPFPYRVASPFETVYRMMEEKNT